jgi:hypothetical protein
VRVARDGAGLSVTAGGRVAAPHDRARLEAQIARLLAEPARRARWVAAARGSGR